jgi:putative endonuclease
MHYLYIIYSESKDKYYVGETNDPEFRLKLHNQHAFDKSFTKIAEDWQLKLNYDCQNRSDAIYLEKFIKRMKSRKFIQKIIDQPEILNDILSKK